jgi:hypothetical protein
MIEKALLDKFDRDLTINNTSDCFTQKISRLSREIFTGVGVLAMISTPRFDQDSILVLRFWQEYSIYVTVCNETVAISI